MNPFVCLVFQVTLINSTCTLLFCCCEATSIALSPLGMVSVCPGGQVLLTCERINGSVLFWDVSVPHGASPTTNEQRIVASQGSILSPEFRIGFTEFNVTRTSDSPLTSQLLINNVTTEINGSTIYCSEDGDETNSPMTVINIKYKERSADHSFKIITLMNHFLRNSVTVTLQWPREPGAVYHVGVSPETPHTELITSGHILMINLTFSYNIQYNVSIVSSLCGVTTTKLLNYAAADCGVPLVDSNVILDYSSTLEGSVLTLTCENDTSRSTDEEILSVTCHSSGNWIPDPAQFTCSLSTEISPLTTVQTTPVMQTGSANLIAVILSTMTIVCAVCSIVFLSIGYACGWFSQKHKQSRTRKAASDSSVEENTGPSEGSQLPQTPGPLYEELQQRSTPEHQDLVELKENVAYGPIVK